MIPKIALVLFLACLATGCVAQEPYMVYGENPEGKPLDAYATLEFPSPNRSPPIGDQRDERWHNPAELFKVDDKIIPNSRIRPDDLSFAIDEERLWWVFMISPGKHKITVRNEHHAFGGDDDYEINFEKGKRYWVFSHNVKLGFAAQSWVEVGGDPARTVVAGKCTLDSPGSNEHKGDGHVDDWWPLVPGLDAQYQRAKKVGNVPKGAAKP